MRVGARLKGGWSLRGWRGGRGRDQDEERRRRLSDEGREDGAGLRWLCQDTSSCTCTALAHLPAAEHTNNDDVPPAPPAPPSIQGYDTSCSKVPQVGTAPATGSVRHDAHPRPRNIGLYLYFVQVALVPVKPLSSSSSSSSTAVAPAPAPPKDSMVVSTSIQNQALPADLPFRLISRTIGQGAYAFIRKACPLNAYNPVIAVKFINKDHAYKTGRVKPKQIATEVALHSHVGRHQNIIQFLSTGEDRVWTWIAMELAEGDLFDKIEADEGVGQDIAHFYFTQLISAVGYMHSRDVAHRDIKPENILLSDGDLKLADFGLAVLFGFQGQKKLCQTVCGSPPYMAPEVVPKEGFTGQRTAPYEGDMADIWSCGVVLFVLLVGNTPWDEPTRNSFEFNDYLDNGPTDDLWTKIPFDVISLLKGMLKVNPADRFTLEDVRRHPWFTQRNPHLASDGRAANPVGLATQMLESLRIDFTADPTLAPSSQRRRAPSSADAMDLDMPYRLALTQPETPTSEIPFSWEQHLPTRFHNGGISASQPTSAHHAPPPLLSSRFTGDPALSQFSATPSVPLSVTQQARRFRDVVPEASLARFLSFMNFSLLLPLIAEALHRLGIPVAPLSAAQLSGEAGRAVVVVKTRDGRNCALAGTVVVERVEEEVLEVRFLKAKGDPVEWRRLFKRVVVLCKDGILRPD